MADTYRWGTTFPRRATRATKLESACITIAHDLAGAVSKTVLARRFTIVGSITTISVAINFVHGFQWFALTQLPNSKDRSDIFDWCWKVHKGMCSLVSSPHKYQSPPDSPLHNSRMLSLHVLSDSFHRSEWILGFVKTDRNIHIESSILLGLYCWGRRDNPCHSHSPHFHRCYQESELWSASPATADGRREKHR